MADKVKASYFKAMKNTICNTLKQNTKYAHTVRGRPALKYIERFRNGSVRELYERSLYERTFMREPIENHVISKLFNVDLNKHLRKHRLRDRKPSRIPIRTLKRLMNKSRKVRKFVYEGILSCIPRSSTVCCGSWTVYTAPSTSSNFECKCNAN